MDNGKFGKKNPGQERSKGKSSRESKKSSRSKESKKRQRGVGVAALEKIISEMESKSTNFAPSPQHHAYPTLSQMGEMGELESENISHGGIQFSTMTGLIPCNGAMLESQQFTEPNMLYNFMNLPVESAQYKKKEPNDAVGSSISQNSGTGEDEELDLDLKL